MIIMDMNALYNPESFGLYDSIDDFNFFISTSFSLTLIFDVGVFSFTC